MVKHRVVNFTLNHAKLLNHSGESTKPSSRRLFKTIQRFMQMTNKAKRLPVSNKTWRLLHIDFFLKITMQENILDIQLMK